MHKRELLELVELAYAPAESDGAWLERFGRQLSHSVGGAVLPFGYIFQKSAGGPPVFDEAFMEGQPSALEWFRETHATLDQAMMDSFFPTGTSSSLFSERFAAGIDRGSSTPSIDIEQLMAGVGGNDSWALYSVDAAGRGVLSGSITHDMDLRPRDREQHCRLAVHLAAGFRLRALFADDTRVERADAIIEPGGAVADARGAAQGGLEVLRRAVSRVEEARSSKRSAHDEPLDLWQGLVEGRWSVVDHRDSDGRRFYLAMANPPLAVIDRALTRLEAAAAAMGIAGESNKVIGYALGIAESTAAGLLSSAIRKLGVASRVDLIRLGVALGATLDDSRAPSGASRSELAT